jgi:hypothetical protein
MSMNYSEFRRQLGTDPGSRDPAYLRARQSSVEFIQAAAESDLFERRLRRALAVDAPPDLVSCLKEMGAPGVRAPIPWRRYALAAGVLLAIAAAGVSWRMNPRYDSVEQYVAFHYSHDGPGLLAQGGGHLADNVDEVLTRFHVTLTPEARQMVGLIKFCPTPRGRGAHIVLNTPRGPITVIFMPGTTVTDGEMMVFDGMQAQLVVLTHGSAAVIGTETQHISGFHTLVQNAFIPLSNEV